MRINKSKIIYFILIIIIPVNLFSQNKADQNIGLKMAIKMADSEMALFPDCSTVDFDPAGKWNYTPGLIATAMVELWKQTGEEKYYGYVKSYADKFIDENGQIAGYKKSDFNIDKINSGKFLFDLLKVTGDKKYEKAIFVLRDQLKDQPRTSEGGFWHKKRYTNQMWLDGLYMGAPFYARFAKEYEPEDFDDVINQFLIVHKHTYNEKAGLNYHGWDESREQKWADPETGCSPHFWGRAMGWYAMALVDVLDYIPEEHQGRAELLKILNQVASGIKKYQDKKTGLWYQVLNLPDREGNYLESSVSSMFVYAISKAVRMGYIGKDYGAVAQNGYNGIIKNFIKNNNNNTISLTTTCAVAGLGGDPYRPGTFEYYVGEPVRDNDPKGVGPFILASIEMGHINH
ncbi:MAG: glycoside hydrolase family 88 protein [Prolixibacteraceae bacterium]|nr:glycoside hydrolase family 88 protein [Prolixibacteraceae bacterium]